MDFNKFAQFNEMFDLDGLKNDIENSDKPFEFVDVPYGQYEVGIASMEMGLTSEKAKNPNKPILKVRFKIIAGEYKGQSLFYNQSLISGMGIHSSNQFLKSLETEQNIEFKDFVQYADLIENVKNSVISSGGEFALNYYEEKGWDRYEITQRFM